MSSWYTSVIFHERSVGSRSSSSDVTCARVRRRVSIPVNTRASSGIACRKRSTAVSIASASSSTDASLVFAFFDGRDSSVSRTASFENIVASPLVRLWLAGSRYDVRDVMRGRDLIAAALPHDGETLRVSADPSARGLVKLHREL